MDTDKTATDENEIMDGKVAALNEKYKPRIEAVLKAIGEAFQRAGYTGSLDIWDMTDEEFRYSIGPFLRPGTVQEEGADLPESAVDVSFTIVEARVRGCDDDEKESISFMMNIVTVGGSILGGMSPGNYSDDWVVDINDEDEVEERFSHFENADPESALPDSE